MRLLTGCGGSEAEIAWLLRYSRTAGADGIKTGEWHAVGRGANRVEAAAISELGEGLFSLTEDGKRVLSASGREMQIIDVISGQTVATIDSETAIAAALLSTDGHRLVVVGHPNSGGVASVCTYYIDAPDE